MAGRPSTKSEAKRIHILLDSDLLEEVKSVRDASKKEKLTHQIEDGLRRHIRSRKRSKPSD